MPNALTLGNMFCGFLAIIYASSGRSEKAVIAIAIAILLDGLDGRVARRLNATSKFGIEFDSFSDLVSFGIAPAILIYNWAFRVQADEFGVFVCFIYALCAASRLAKFNITEPNSKGFIGLPTPGAAGMVVSFVYLMPESDPNLILAIVSSLLMISLAYLMVSNIPFLKLGLRRRVGLNLSGTLGLGALIALVWYYNRLGFFLLALAYCLSGPLTQIFGKFRKRELAATDNSDSPQSGNKENSNSSLKLMK